MGQKLKQAITRNRPSPDRLPQFRELEMFLQQRAS